MVVECNRKVRELSWQPSVHADEMQPDEIGERKVKPDSPARAIGRLKARRVLPFDVARMDKMHRTVVESRAHIIEHVHTDVPALAGQFHGRFRNERATHLALISEQRHMRERGAKTACAERARE